MLNDVNKKPAAIFFTILCSQMKMSQEYWVKWKPACAAAVFQWCSLDIELPHAMPVTLCWLAVYAVLRNLPDVVCTWPRAPHGIPLAQWWSGAELVSSLIKALGRGGRGGTAAGIESAFRSCLRGLCSTPAWRMLFPVWERTPFLCHLAHVGKTWIIQ